MNTRLLKRLISIVPAALLGHEAASMEEIVVYGTDTSVSAEIVAEHVAETMSEYVSALNDAQKRALEAEMAALCEKRIQIAAATLPTRG